MTRIAVVASAPMTISSFLAPHIERLAHDYEVSIICNLGQSTELQKLTFSNVSLFDIAISRDPSVFQDLRVLVKLIRLLVFLRPAVVQTVTPKAGLVGMLAAWIARVPIRIHWFTGQVWANATGLKLCVLRTFDRLISKLATDILVDGRPQLTFLLEHGVLQPGKGVVINQGSIRGVDANRFRPSLNSRIEVRADLGLPDDAFVVCFAGRLRERKGFLDLLEAMSLLPPSISAKLLAIGHDEEDLRFTASDKLGDDFVYVPYTDQVEKYIASADVLVLPSYREGFGQSVLEASACELPVVVTDIYGLADAVVDGVTGLTVELGNPSSIAWAIETLFADPDKRFALGSAGRRRAIELFDQNLVIDAYTRYVEDLLRARELEGPD